MNGSLVYKYRISRRKLCTTDKKAKANENIALRLTLLNGLKRPLFAFFPSLESGRSGSIDDRQKMPLFPRQGLLNNALFHVRWIYFEKIHSRYGFLFGILEFRKYQISYSRSKSRFFIAISTKPGFRNLDLVHMHRRFKERLQEKDKISCENSFF